MPRQEHPSNSRLILAVAAALAVLSAGAVNARAMDVEKQNTSLYRDVFDQNLYYEGTDILRLDRMYRLLFRKKVRALDVNVFDEVPDSAFFINRHARERLSAEALRKGAPGKGGPDLSGPLYVYKGKAEGMNPGFFVEDSRGDRYLLKFDAYDNLELITSAEVIGSRFYYALGYNVPEYTVVEFDPSKLVPKSDAQFVDETGFWKDLTPERLEEQLMFMPRTEAGNLRASASRILEGKNLGFMNFKGRRKGDPEDRIDHERRREIRALLVFSTWVNNYDLRESNSMDMLVSENGQEKVMHYLLDFSDSLGSSATGPKPPMFNHEYMFDYGETAKAFLSLGLREKPWQKRLREAGGTNEGFSPAVGYFDNNYFDAGRAKVQLPYYAFKDLTRADGFWAAKIIKTFTDEDIRAMVEAGRLSRQEDTDYLVKVLTERRDMIARYWFKQANPLDEFDMAGDALTFRDLAVEAGFEPEHGNTYHFDVIASRDGKKGEKLASPTSGQPALNLDPSWLNTSGTLSILIRTSRQGSEEMSPYVLVELDNSGITGVTHED